MTAGSGTLRSHAEVPTLRAERWREQLASHLGRGATAQVDGETVRLLLAGGSCAMSCDDSTLASPPRLPTSWA